jgi:hypothetical protein
MSTTLRHRDNRSLFILPVLVLLLALTATASAQTTGFTYQGRLTDGGNPADGMYDMQFKLFDVNNIQQGQTISFSSVQATNGVFKVDLDFGSATFDGTRRYLEIGVRPENSSDPHTVLSPRQLVTAAPYSIRSIVASTADTANTANTATSATNSAQLGGLAASQYVLTTDSRMTDARPPAAGSNNYIQNTFLTPQNANFNISGNGTVSGQLKGATINATSEFHINGARVLSVAGIGNLFAGLGAGLSNTMGSFNSFFGRSAGALNMGNGNSFFGAFAGRVNTTGQDNSFFGLSAGDSNSTGHNNSFFGRFAGRLNTEGGENSFFGWSAGDSNTTGFYNSFFGHTAGFNNTTGDNNSFFGRSAGESNTEGGDNSFFGRSAGESNTTGRFNSFFGSSAGFSNETGTENSFFGLGAGLSHTTGHFNSFFGAFAGKSNFSGIYNTIIGYSADVGSANLTNATAIGHRAFVTQSNSLVLGSINGVNNASASVNVGIGTTTPNFPLSFENSVGDKISLWGQSGNHYGFGIQGGLLQIHTSGSSDAVAFGFGSSASFTETMRVKGNGNVGIGTSSPSDKLHVAGDIRIGTGTTGCVKDADGTLIAGACSSDLRFKRNITPFPYLLDKLVRLQPVHFYWRENEFPERHFGAGQSYGLIAQDVEAVLPELVSTDEQGFKVVNYSKLSLMLLQAIREQHQIGEKLNSDKGQIERVKYAQISTVINAVREQQQLIKQQQNQLTEQRSLIEQQQRQLESLKKLVCQGRTKEKACR